MSSKQAQWYHSMNFTYLREWNDTEKKHGTINTWDDWHLIPTSRPVFNPPSVKEVYIDIPGSNGKLDMTESLAGYPLYDNRTGSFEFIVANGWRPLWIGGYQKFANWLHGKDLVCVLDDDPSYYYTGRFTMKEWKSNNDGTWSNVTFDYNVAPYKLSKRLSTEDWLWDPFCFDTDIIHPKTVFEISGETKVHIFNNKMPVIPVICFYPVHEPNSSQLSTLTISTSKATIVGIPAGEFRDPRLEMLDGDNTITLTGYGTVAIRFRMGSL